jgi:hypothetical protein
MNEYAKVLPEDQLLQQLRTVMDISTNDALDEIRWNVRDNIPPEARQTFA